MEWVPAVLDRAKVSDAELLELIAAEEKMMEGHGAAGDDEQP